MNLTKQKAASAALAVAMVAAIVLLYPRGNARSDAETVPTITHQQETWLAALEWCESRGDAGAINPKDLDGTPSYGAYQFKPSTLDYFARKYGVETKGLMDYAMQRAVVEQMILHRDEIKWSGQFPWCVKKLGNPPK